MFGRIRYDLMAGFWPTSFATDKFPVVAKRMNRFPKVVFSRTRDRATWNNTTLVMADIAEAVRTMK